MKEIDGLIACSHYGVIEWLCTYDQTVNADVARKRSAWSHGGDVGSPPLPRQIQHGSGKTHGLGDPRLPPISALGRCPGATSSSKGMEQVSRFIQWHWVTKTHHQPAQFLAWALGHRDHVL